MTADWVKFLGGILGAMPSSNDPITGFLTTLVFVPLLMVVALWVVQMALELVLWPVFVAVRATGRAATG